MKMSEQINELATALVVAQGLIQNPTKSVKNDFFKSKYADLAGVLDVVRPAFTKAGIAVIQAPSTGAYGEIGVTTTLVHTSVSGCQIKSQWQIDPAAKNPAQAAGSYHLPSPVFFKSHLPMSRRKTMTVHSLAGNVKAVEQKPVDIRRSILRLPRLSALRTIKHHFAVKAGIANGDLSQRIEAWFELENED